jgi:hypothetical protein
MIARSLIGRLSAAYSAVNDEPPAAFQQLLQRLPVSLADAVEQYECLR